MNGVMVQDTSAIVQEAFMEAVKPTRPFSASRLIGGKLRALYDEDAQPSPSQIFELLDSLDRDHVAHGISTAVW